MTPGISAAPGLDSIAVDSVGSVIITGQAGTNSMTGQFPPPPAPAVSNSESFVLKIDPAGARILGGIGGMVALDGQGNIYVTGLKFSAGFTPIAATPNAFQSEPANACALQYVAKLNPSLNQVLYATYVSGKYGPQPAAISVDAQGNAFVAATTNSPDYPTTINAYGNQLSLTAGGQHLTREARDSSQRWRCEAGRSLLTAGHLAMKEERAHMKSREFSAYWRHSPFMTIEGSVLAARNAGIKPDSVATINKSKPALIYVAESVGATPNKRDRRSRVAA